MIRITKFTPFISIKILTKISSKNNKILSSDSQEKGINQNCLPANAIKMLKIKKCFLQSRKNFF